MNQTAAFKFKISKVEKLSRAGVEVFDGTVLAGQVTTGQEVLLVHDGKKVPLRVAGVKLGAQRRPGLPATLSLSFKRQPGLEVAREGDELVAA